MNRQQAIADWLLTRSRLRLAGNLFGGMVLLALGLVILFVTFWVVYIVIYLGFNWIVPISHTVRLWVTAAVIGLLFIGNATAGQRHRQSLSFSTMNADDEPFTIHVPMVGIGATLLPLSSDAAHANVKVIAGLLTTGPRSVTAGLRMLAKAVWPPTLDVEGCAAVLDLLLDHEARVPFEEIVPAISAGHDVSEVLTEVQAIDGVRLVCSEPAGMALYSDLREELLELGGRRPSRKRVPKQPASDRDEAVASLVLLLTEPRDLDADLLTQFINETFKLDLVASAEPDSTEYVVGSGPLLFAQFHDQIIHVLTAGKPYFDDPEAAALQVKELRIRKSIHEHRAFLSVSLMLRYDKSDTSDPYLDLGKLIVALAPADTLAVVCPAHSCIRVWEDNVMRKLAGARPLEAFSIAPEKLPVIEVPEDDPRMKAATAEARRRWPEFAAAFANRQPKQTFSVKLPFRDGEHRECMWLSVLSLDGDTIHGKVDNEPVNVTTVRLGSRVRANRQHLIDWLYIGAAGVVGGFTVKVLQEGLLPPAKEGDE